MRNDQIRRLLAPQPSDVSAADMAALNGPPERVIPEMKRLAKCETDQELAAFLHKDHSAIAQWRRRGSVPEAARLRFLIMLEGQRAA